MSINRLSFVLYSMLVLLSLGTDTAFMATLMYLLILEPGYFFGQEVRRA
jgi:hypothetical protein